MLKTASIGSSPAKTPLLTGAAAGLLAGAVTGQVDRFLDRYVSAEQKKRDRKVRKAPAHRMAGPYFARKIVGRKLSAKEAERARMAFQVAYGVVWGVIYAAVRKKAPRLSRWGGLPFGVPFFIVCDGVMAPLLGVSPTLRKIPWQPSVKELCNHVAWTAAAELFHRAVGRTAVAR